MKVFLILASVVIFLTGGGSAQQKWNPQEVKLSSEIRSQAVTIDSKAIEYIFMVAPETREVYGRARYTIDVFIDEMNCITNFTDTEPNYLKFDSESGEISIPTYTKCTILKKGEALPFQFNDGSNIGADKIRVKPIGIKWSNESNNAIIRAELTITREIILGDEIPQMDIQLDPTIGYEISAAQESKFCSKSSGYKCRVSMTISSMLCSQSPQELGSGLRYNYTDFDGIHSGVVCNYGTHKTSLQSLDFIKSELAGEKKDTMDTRVTVNLQLYSDKNNSCPSGYFKCGKSFGKDKAVTSCVPISWKCDGRQNCPGENGGSDESFNDCNVYSGDDYYCYYTYGYSGWSLAWGVLTLILMLTGIIIIISAVKKLCLQRRVVRPRTNINTEAYPTKDLPPSYVQATTA